jgi:hypothetical protein
MAESPPNDDEPFHTVVFGEGTQAEQRFAYAEFQDVPLRQRVRLLMGMPARFFSATGAEIPRAQAMRIRVTDDEPSGRGASEAAASSSGDVEPLARLLGESDELPALRHGVKAAQTVFAREPKSRAALAAGLLRAAELLGEHDDDRGTICAALRRFGELAPTGDLAGLYTFIRPGTHAEVMQAAMQALWSGLSAHEDFGLGVVAVRTRQLLNKYLDADWLCLPTTQALAADCLLAYSVLAPSEEEPSLRVLFKRARGLAPALPINYVHERITEALSFALDHGRSIKARLELLAELACAQP